MSKEGKLPVCVRLAPSPTGSFHIGTARTAVFNWLFARRHGGRFLLRIEDTDLERSRAEFTTDILDGLQWLGLDWDDEPVIQSHRNQAHRDAITTLLDKGLAYRCYTSEEELTALREQQKAAGLAPRYDNRHRHLSTEQEEAFRAEGRQPVIRFRIDDHEVIRWQDLVRGEMAWTGSDLGGDMVIARRAPAGEIGNPLYNLVVVVDDAAMAISHVIRGEDHIANTAKQLLLYRALDLPIPTFAHTPLILNREGRKLSKRDGVTSISDFRDMGYTAEALANYMTLLGWSPPEGMGERFSLDQAAAVFDFARVNKAGARFDWDKLDWLNAQVLHDLAPDQLLSRVLPLWQARGWETPGDTAADTPPSGLEASTPAEAREWQENLCDLLGPSLTRLSDAVEQATPFFTTPEPDAPALAQLQRPEAREVLRALLDQLDGAPAEPFGAAQAAERLSEAARAAGQKKGVMMKSLRAALLGSLQGPDLVATWVLLHRRGMDLERIRSALSS